MRKEFVIDGNKFDDLEGFYDEIDNLLTKDLTWKTGHNFAAFNDLLRGGFGVHEYGEPILLRWINFQKSKSDFGYDATVKYYKEILSKCHPANIEYITELLENAEYNKGETLMEIIIEIILDTNNSGHDCMLETID
ncbi:hypothetical protein FACS189485_19890 [Spirochaetia bacterium]|nr:hypothetical protein FACS189485_19890 [Spirochaetia bacterium]